MSSKTIDIEHLKIGADHPPVFIAEMSGNHNQSIERALQIVDAAAEAKAHGVKIQTFTADTMTLNLNTPEFTINDPNSLWYGKNLYELYDQAKTPWEWHKPIFDRCREKGLIGFSTPFDESAVDFLESLDVPCYKIASFENEDEVLIEKVAQTGKPVIISLGLSTKETIENILKIFSNCKNDQLILLKCTSAYPALPTDCHINSLETLINQYSPQFGLSDHTMGIGVAIAAIAKGAQLVEKHFTLNRSDGGVDGEFSMEPEEFKTLVLEGTKAWESLGQSKIGAQGLSESQSKKFKRSLYVSADIKKGDSIQECNIKRIRPGFGLPAKMYREVLGKKVKRDLKSGTALQLEDIE